MEFYILLPCVLVQFLLTTNWTHFFRVFVYFTSLHVSSNPVLIIRRINCSNTLPGRARGSVVVKALRY